MDGWERCGGLSGMAAALGSSVHDGIDGETAETMLRRKHLFGANLFKEVPSKGFLALWFGNLKDPTLLMLMFAALVNACGD